MAAYTTSQAGNWSAQATWGGSGPPGAGDTATVNHAVTVDTNTTIGVNGSTSLTINAGLTVSTGITLTVQGNVIQGNANFILSAGSTLTFATASGDVKWLFGDVASFGVYANCIFKANGTSGSHCAVTKTGGNLCWFDDFSEAAATGSEKSGWDCTYCDFTGVSNSDGSLGVVHNSFGSKSAKFDHCTFTSCGTVNLARIFSGAGSQDYYVRDCVWTSSTGARSLWVDGGTFTGGTQEFHRNFFDKVARFVRGGYSYQDNYFGDAVEDTTADKGTLKGNFYHQNTNSGPNQACLTQLVQECYQVCPPTHPGNMHGIAPSSGARVTQFIFESQGTSGPPGEMVYVGGPATVTVDHCLALPIPSGDALGAMVNNLAGGASGQWAVNHNTVVGAAIAHIVVSEADPAGTPQYSSVKSNLVVDPSASTANIVTDLGSNYDDPVLGANATHNGMFGQASFADPLSGQTLQGYRANFNAAPGANDVIGNPNFVDSTRNFAAWAVYKGAASSGDTLAVKTAAGVALIKADRTLTRLDLIPWVMAGFAPQNIAFKAAHDSVAPSNGWIGAVEGEIAVPTTYRLGPNPQAGTIHQLSPA